MGIYERDGMGSALSAALNQALARRQAAVERSAGYRNANVAAITGLIKSLGRAGEMSEKDELEKKMDSLKAELAEAQAAQAEKERNVLLDRSLTAAQGMTDYRPAMAQGQLNYMNAMNGVLRGQGGYRPRVGGSQYTMLDEYDSMMRRGGIY